MFAIRVFWSLLRAVLLVVRYRARGLVQTSGLFHNLDIIDRDVFLMGSGSSINNISAEEWTILENEITIGVNDFVRHEFTADIYALEVSSLPEKFLANIELFRGHVTKRRANPPKLTVKATNSKFSMRIIPDLSKVTEIHVHFPATFSGDNERQLNFSLRALLAFRRITGQQNIFFNQTSTIIRMAVAAALVGARRIFIMGVDLEGGYFWENDKALNNQAPNVETGSSLPLHETETNVPLPASQAITVLAKILPRLTGTSVVWLGDKPPRVPGSLCEYLKIS